jgi:hypothetical protein
MSVLEYCFIRGYSLTLFPAAKQLDLVLVSVDVLIGAGLFYGLA